MKDKIKRDMENLLYKAATDKNFREKCLSSGRRILEGELGLKLEKDVRVLFKEEGTIQKDVNIEGKEIIFILPPFVGKLNKLDREDLERIAGGVRSSMRVNDDSMVRLESFLLN